MWKFRGARLMALQGTKCFDSGILPGMSVVIDGCGFFGAKPG